MTYKIQLPKMPLCNWRMFVCPRISWIVCCKSQKKLPVFLFCNLYYQIQQFPNCPISSLAIISGVLGIVHLITCYANYCHYPFFFLLFVVDFYSSKDHGDENITIQKEWHSKSVSKNGHTKRCGRSKVWQGGWDLLEVTIHSEKPDSIKLVSPPPDDPTPASPSFMSYTRFKFCV